MTTPIPIPAEYDDTDTYINAVQLAGWLAICLPARVSICRPSVCLSVRPSVRPSICLTSSPLRLYRWAHSTGVVSDGAGVLQGIPHDEITEETGEIRSSRAPGGFHTLRGSDYDISRRRRGLSPIRIWYGFFAGINLSFKVMTFLHNRLMYYAQIRNQINQFVFKCG